LQSRQLPKRRLAENNVKGVLWAPNLTLEKIAMKKTLIALAVLASSGAAMAQSTFTLYGVADVNVERARGVKLVGGVPGTGATSNLTRVTSGGLSGSRWGLRGSEDLGSGLKGVFVAESGINFDDGTTGVSYPAAATQTSTAALAGTSRLFGRQAFVGLEGGFGGVRLGRQYTPIGNLADYIGTLPLDVLPVLGVLAGSSSYRTDNAVTYTTPSFAGFTASGQYSTGNNGEVADNKAGRAGSINGIYENGPILAAVGYIEIQDANYISAADQERKEFMLVGGYDFGFAKARLHYSETELTTPGVATSPAALAPNKMKVFGLKAAIPFGAFTVTPGFAVGQDVTGAADRTATGAVSPKDDVKIFTLVAAYDLSKRTTAYGRLTVVDNEAGSNKGFNYAATAAGDKGSNAIQLGVRHTF
jgi:predicted porin